MKPDIIKTHSGLFSAFSQFLIKEGPVSREMGKLLKRAEEIRIVADYRGDSVELKDAHEIVLQAELFVETLRSQFIEGDGTAT